MRAGEIAPYDVMQVDEPYVPRQQRNTQREGIFTTLAVHRNRVLDMAMQHDADVLLSLDTDVFLTEPDSIERLLDALECWPLAAPVTYLSPPGPPSLCFNAGNWQTNDIGSPTRVWERIGEGEFREAAGDVVEVDIPMAAVMMVRDVIQWARYSYHETGEDAGFAQSLDFLGFRTAWLTGLYAPHVMLPGLLDEMVPV